MVGYKMSDKYPNHIQFDNDTDAMGYPRKIYNSLEDAKRAYELKIEGRNKAAEDNLKKIGKSGFPLRHTPMICQNPMGDGYILVTLGLAQKYGLVEVYPVDRTGMVNTLNQVYTESIREVSETVVGKILNELLEDEVLLEEPDVKEKMMPVEEMERPSDILPEHWVTIKDIIINDKWEIKHIEAAYIKKATEVIFDHNGNRYNRETVKNADVDKLSYYCVQLLDKSYGIEKSVHVKHYEIEKGYEPDYKSTWDIRINHGTAIVFDLDNTNLSNQIRYKVILKRLTDPKKKELVSESEEKREVLPIKFVCVDEWNRPIFKPVNKDKKYYLSDVNNLFGEDATEEEVKKFYSDLTYPLRDYITYHGRSIDSEPMGDRMKFDLEVV